MFAPIRALRERLRKRRETAHRELTLETSNLTPSQIATAQKALRILGLEPRQQELSKQDFTVFLYAMGLNPTEDTIESKIRAYNLHHRKTFTFGQLAHLWYSMLQDLTDEEEILKRAFQFFDKDGNGEISVQELRTTMRELGDLLTEKEIATFMQIMDVNNDGAIGYHEFLETLKTQAADTTAEDGPRPELLPALGPSTMGDTTPSSRPQTQYDTVPLNVPASAPTGIASAALPSPFAARSVTISGSGGGCAAANGGTTEGGTGPLDPSASGPLAPHSAQLPPRAGSVRRQTSLKPSLLPPPPAMAEPLLNSDPSQLQRHGSRRLLHQTSQSQSTAGCQQPLPPSLERTASQRSRSGDVPAAGGSPRARLRAPSTLEPGTGSDNSDGGGPAPDPAIGRP